MSAVVVMGYDVVSVPKDWRNFLGEIRRDWVTSVSILRWRRDVCDEDVSTRTAELLQALRDSRLSRIRYAHLGYHFLSRIDCESQRELMCLLGSADGLKGIHIGHVREGRVVSTERLRPGAAQAEKSVEWYRLSQVVPYTQGRLQHFQLHHLKVFSTNDAEQLAKCITGNRGTLKTIRLESMIFSPPSDNDCDCCRRRTCGCCSSGLLDPVFQAASTVRDCRWFILSGSDRDPFPACCSPRLVGSTALRSLLRKGTITRLLLRGMRLNDELCCVLKEELLHDPGQLVYLDLRYNPMIRYKGFNALCHLLNRDVVISELVVDNAERRNQLNLMIQMNRYGRTRFISTEGVYTHRMDWLNWLLTMSRDMTGLKGLNGIYHTVTSSPHYVAG